MDTMAQLFLSLTLPSGEPNGVSIGTIAILIGLLITFILEELH